MWLFTSIYRVANTLANARDAVRGVADRRTEAVAACCARIAETTEEMHRLLAAQRAPRQQGAGHRRCTADFVGIVGGEMRGEEVQLMEVDRPRSRRRPPRMCGDGQPARGEHGA